MKNKKIKNKKIKNQILQFKTPQVRERVSVPSQKTG